MDSNWRFNSYVSFGGRQQEVHPMAGIGMAIGMGLMSIFGNQPEKRRRYHFEDDERQMESQNKQIGEQNEEVRKQNEELEKKKKDIEEKKKKEEENNQRFEKAKSLFEKQKVINNEVIQKKITVSLKKKRSKYFNMSLSKNVIAKIESLINNIFTVHDITTLCQQYLTLDAKHISSNLYESMGHFNIVLAGKTGVGKSTLTNAFLHLDKTTCALTGTGQPVTTILKKYTSNEIPTLRLWDDRGIESNDYGVKKVIQTISQLVDAQAQQNDPDMYIHALWYCVSAPTLRFEQIEKDAITELMKLYDGSKLPIIIVLTQAYDSNDVKPFKDNIAEFIAKPIDIIPVVALENFTIKPYGLNDLLEHTAHLASQAAGSACYHSIKLQLQQHIDTLIIKLTDKANVMYKQYLSQPHTGTQLVQMLDQLSGVLESITMTCLSFDNSSMVISNGAKNHIRQILNLYKQMAHQELLSFKKNKLTKIENTLSKTYAEMHKSIESIEKYSLPFNAYETQWKDYVIEQSSQTLDKNSDREAFEVIANYLCSFYLQTIKTILTETFYQSLTKSGSIIEEIAQKKISNLTQALLSKTKQNIICN